MQDMKAIFLFLGNGLLILYFCKDLQISQRSQVPADFLPNTHKVLFLSCWT